MQACFINAAATGRTEATDRKSISCSLCLQRVAATYSLITRGPCQSRPANAEEKKGDKGQEHREVELPVRMAFQWLTDQHMKKLGLCKKLCSFQQSDSKQERK